MPCSKYHESFPLRAEGLARDGLTDEAIAAALGISRTTYYAFQKRHPEFAAAVRRGKVPMDTKVENALLKRALGHTCKETHLEDIVDRKTGEVIDSLKRKVVIKQVLPNVSAAIFWLKNRRPDKYRDKQDIGLSGEFKLNFDKQDENL